jgi:hypothetical protein
MKPVLALAVLGMILAAGAAHAQSGVEQLQLGVLQAEQANARQRAISQQNEMMALESRLRADDSVRLIQRQSAQANVASSANTPADARSPGMVAIPDAALDASRARIEAISRQHH